MAAAVILIWCAAVFRWRLSLSAPVTLWRTSFTSAVTLVAIGTTVSTWPRLLDVLSPNLSDLTVHVTTSLAGGFVLVYLLTLNRTDPPTVHVRAIFASAIAIVGIQALAWSLAPIHTSSLVDLGAGPRSGWLLLYFVTYYAYLMCVLFGTALSCARMVTTRSIDLSARAGLAVISPAALIGGLALALFAGHVVLAFEVSHRRDVLSTVGNLIAPWSIGGIGLGTVLFVVGPHLAARASMRRTIATLAPLHETLRLRYPGIGMESDRNRSLAFRQQRMLIEIHDALQRLVIPPRLLRCGPYEAVIRALIHPSHDCGGPTARELLPRAATREDDEQVLLTLARAYEDTRHA